MFFSGSNYGVLILIGLSIAAIDHPSCNADEIPATVTPPAEESKLKGMALSFGFSPIYSPQITGADRLAALSPRSFDLCLENQKLMIGIRYGHFSVQKLQIYDTSAFTTNYPAGGSLTLIESYLGFDLPLNAPHEWLGPFQLIAPLKAAFAIGSIKADSDQYIGMTFEGSVGLGARLYTSTLFRPAISASYHFGLPFVDFTQTTTGNGIIQNSNGETIKLGLSGFELRVELALLFGEGPR